MMPSEQRNRPPQKSYMDLMEHHLTASLTLSTITPSKYNSNNNENNKFI